MTKVSTSEFFNCSVEQFYKIISDFENYPEFLNEISRCSIIESNKNKHLIEFEIQLIKSFTYRLWMNEEKPNKLSWEIDGSNLFKVNSGFWELSVEDNRCKADYYLECELKVFVPNLIEKTLAEVNLPNVMSAYHQRVSDLYDKTGQ